MRRLNVFINAVLAGICIALGGTAFLVVDNKVVGALLFCLGLFTVLTHGLNLYTGKVCYVFERPLEFAIDLPVIWIGNLVGTVLTGTLINLTRVVNVSVLDMTFFERAESIAMGKLNDGLLSIFILAIFCNILIFVAVDGFNNNKHELGKYLAIIFGVVGFIVCGFEHCVANMFYFTVGRVWSGQAMLYILVMTLGNAVGGVIFPLLRSFKNRCEERQSVSMK